MHTEQNPPDAAHAPVLTVGELISHLAQYDPMLPVGIISEHGHAVGPASPVRVTANHSSVIDLVARSYRGGDIDVDTRAMSPRQLRNLLCRWIDQRFRRELASAGQRLCSDTEWLDACAELLHAATGGRRGDAERLIWAVLDRISLTTALDLAEGQPVDGYSRPTEWLYDQLGGEVRTRGGA